MNHAGNKNNPFRIARQCREGSLIEFSRRHFVQLLMLAGVGLTIPPQIANASLQPQDLNKELERVAGLVARAQTEAPNLPGFKNLDSWAASTFSKKFSPPDAEILKGALYLKALTLLDENQQRKSPAPTLETLREVFTNPDPMSCVTNDYLNKLLNAAQMKVSKQPEFAGELKNASTQLASWPIGSKDAGPGFIAPIIIIVIIVIIILASTKEAH